MTHENIAHTVALEAQLSDTLSCMNPGCNTTYNQVAGGPGRPKWYCSSRCRLQAHSERTRLKKLEQEILRRVDDPVLSAGVQGRLSRLLRRVRYDLARYPLPPSH